jgi:hypothetical protein
MRSRPGNSREPKFKHRLQDLMWILRKAMPSYRPAEWFPEELIWSEILLAGSFSESGG